MLIFVLLYFGTYPLYIGFKVAHYFFIPFHSLAEIVMPGYALTLNELDTRLCGQHRIRQIVISSTILQSLDLLEK